ncbi:MAG: peroxidase [Planctomycetes bacterium]|nr:peroxidase [Planctomycetota bacterium]
MAAAQEDWRAADLDAPTRALCAYAEKLTRTPAAMTAGDVEALRAHGFDDHAIHDAIQVVSYFNYINRVADAVHVDLEPEMTPYPEG